MVKGVSRFSLFRTSVMILSPLLHSVCVAWYAEGILGRPSRKVTIKKKKQGKDLLPYQRRPKKCVCGWVLWLYAERQRQKHSLGDVSTSPHHVGWQKETENVPSELWTTFYLWLRISFRTLFLFYIVGGAPMISYNIKHLIFSNVGIVNPLLILFLLFIYIEV